MHRFEFYRRDVAKGARRIIEPHWTHDADDRRMTWVVACDDTPDDILDVLRWREYEAQPEVKYGQLSLTHVERAQINFNRTNTFHARSVKAIAVANDISDWVAKYDHTLSVDEHRSMFEDPSDVQQSPPATLRRRAY